MSKKPERDISFVKQLPDDYLMCRTLRHAWSIVYFGRVREADKRWLPRKPIFRSIVRISECIRCQTIRREFFNETQARSYLNGHPFDVISRQYMYPRDYQHRGEARPVNKDFNFELLRRTRG